MRIPAAGRFMRAILATHGVTDRTIRVVDSFEGRPLDYCTAFWIK